MRLRLLWRRTKDRWKQLPRIWKLLLPPLLGLVVFYAVENTRGAIIWKRHHQAEISQNQYLTIEDYRQAYDLEPNEKDFSQVSFMQKWIPTLKPERTGSFNFVIEANSPQQLLQQTAQIEPLIEELHRAKNDSFNYELVNHIRRGIIPYLDLVDIVNVVMLRCEAFLELGRPIEFLKELEVIKILHQQFKECDLDGRFKKMSTNAFIDLARYIHSAKHPVEPDTLLATIQLLISMDDEQTEVSSRQLNAIRLLMLDAISEQQAPTNRQAIAEMIRHDVALSLPLPGALGEQAQDLLAQIFAFLIPEGWVKICKVRVSQQIQARKDKLAVSRKPVSPKRLSGKYMIIVQDLVGDIERTNLITQSDLRIAATALAAKWYELKSDKKVDSLEVLYLALPKEVKLAEFNRHKAISLNWKGSLGSLSVNSAYKKQLF